MRAWSQYAPVRFDTIEEAKQASKTPHMYSVHNNSYLDGSQINIIKVTKIYITNHTEEVVYTVHRSFD